MAKSYCEKMRGKIKNCGYKNGRGYCGWYENKDGKNLFLRSKKEFVYAKYLDKNNFHFLTEQTIFVINDRKYKPDFFIYEDSSYKKLIKIVEVKENKKEAQRYFSYKEFFNLIGICYEVEFSIDRIKRKWLTKDELDVWDNQYKDNYGSYLMAGKLNPMYGFMHSIETKKKIGEQTKKYMKNPDIKQRHSESIRNFWKSDKALPIKQRYAALRTEEAKINNPVIMDKCIFCGKQFEKRMHSKKQTCSGSCSHKHNYKIGKEKHRTDGKKVYKIRIIKYLKLSSIEITTENFENVVKQLKTKNLVPKHFSLNRPVIEKYFGSIDNVIKELQ